MLAAFTREIIAVQAAVAAAARQLTAGSILGSELEALPLYKERKVYQIVSPMYRIQSRGRFMNLSAPTQLIFLISLVLAVIGLLPLVGVTALPYAAWALPAGYILLAASVVFRKV